MSGRTLRVPAALLAAGLLVAAKPVPPPAGPAELAAQARESWRGQGISLCVAELRAVPALGPEDLESICGCAVDRYLAGQGNNLGPQLRLQGALGAQMLACTVRMRPERAGDVARWRAAEARRPAAVTETPPPVTEPESPYGKPGAEESEASADTGGEGTSGGFWAWVSNLGWPAWLSGASVLWWIAIGIFVLGLLILKVRRRDTRNDLSAPPSHMRRGAPPQPPRRPDLPR